MVKSFKNHHFKAKIILFLLACFLIAFIYQLRIWVFEKVVLGFPIREDVELKNYLTVDGFRRSYFLHLPKNYDEGKKYPLVIMLHGAGSNGEILKEISGMNDISDRENFIVAYPNGTGLFNFILSWNAGYCCNYVEPLGVDDVVFLSRFMEKLEEKYKIDEKKIYVAGFSNGAMMAYRLACDLSEKIAAIAAVSSSLSTDGCKPENPVPVILFHGLNDRTIPYEGGRSDTIPTNIFDLFHRPFSESVSFWVKNNLCQPEPEKEIIGNIFKYSYKCVDKNEVVVYTTNAGHTWPGGKARKLWGEEMTNEINASEIIWEFFSRFSN